MNIPLAKPYLDEIDAKAAYQTVLSGWVTQGARVEEFEGKFAAYVGTKYAVAVSSCTAALHLSLIVSGVGVGDEVICPSFSFIATSNSIVQAGAIPVFADIDPYTLNIDPVKVESLITSKTKAILIVHQLGMPADIDAFKEICKKNNLKLIEDAACAIGSVYKEKKIGSHSDLVCFSFHPRKVITTGDGGMITTNDLEYYNKLKLLRQHGMSVNDRDRHVANRIIFEEYLIKGFNYRMTDIQAAIGIQQLQKLDEIVEGRRKIADIYFENFKNIPFLQLPYISVFSSSNFQSYSIFIKPDCSISRDEAIERLFKKGIASRRGVMCAHLSKAYQEGISISWLPISEDVSERSFIIPLYYPMNMEEINFIVSSIKDIFAI